MARLTHTPQTSLFLGLLLLCWSTVWWSPAVRASPPPELDITHLESQWLRNPAQVLILNEKLSQNALPADAFQPLQSHHIHQGISDRYYWVRIRLRNNGSQPVDWVVVNETAYLDNLIVYLRDTDNPLFERQHLSDRKPFHSRPLDYRLLALAHSTPAQGYTDLYLHAYHDKTDSISLNFRLQTQADFARQTREENLIYGAYYGILLILFMIALVFSVLLKQSSAIMYAAFLLCTGVMWLLLNGFGFQYLWPNAIYLHNEGFHLVFLLFSICGLQFSKAFLKTRKLLPKVHRLFSGLQIFASFAIVLRLMGSYVLVLHIAFTLLILLAILIPLVSWYAWRNGLHYARWYFFAWLIYSLGLLLAIMSAYSNWSPWELQFLGYVQIGSILEAVFLSLAMTERLMSLERDRREAIALAHQDPLTGLGNRRLLQLQFERFSAQYIIDQVPVFLIMIDLDYFKRINDTYGHDAGDCVLQEVAKLLQTYSRSTDVYVRYGGEEFAILLHADSVQQAQQIAERIRKHFAEEPTCYDGQRISHTLSIGITAVLSEAEKLSAREMMARADAALYESKAAGRNCSIVYG